MGGRGEEPHLFEDQTPLTMKIVTHVKKGLVPGALAAACGGRR